MYRLSGGQAGSVDELVRGTKRGLLVTRFHYTNVVHPIESTITGMTRDGTFLIESGEIAHPVKNLRFTHNSYDVPDPGGWYWLWNGMKQWFQWQGIPQDTDGAVQ